MAFSFEKMRQQLVKGLQCNPLPAQIEQAVKIAYGGHEGQYRDPKSDSDPQIPYIVHPVGVAIITHALLPYADLKDNCEDIISTSLLHDIVEDTGINPKILRENTSERTLELVLALTKPMVRPDSDRNERNEQFFRQIVTAGRTAMFIKICDHCHNLSRPQQKPTHLLEKTIQKGYTIVLRFFEKGNFSDELKSRYMQYLLSAEKQHRAIRQSDPTSESRADHISSKAGYKAIHTYCHIPFKGSSETNIGCEFQIRTSFQDAWSRVSQALSYKKKPNKHVRKALQELADLRNNADSIIDQFSNNR